MSLQNWAIIGTGQISRMVITDLRRCAGIAVTVVHSRDRVNADAFAAQYGIPTATADFDAVIADPAVDVVYIGTPFATHFDLAGRALAAGKHVLVEKPMAMNAAEVERLFEIARANSVFLMEGMWMKFSPIFRRLLQEVAEGRIGEVTSARASFGVPSPRDGGSKWDPERSGGALLDQGIYPLTFAYSVLGPHSRVEATGVMEGGVDATEHMTFHFAGGGYAYCASSIAEAMELTASVNGTSGWLTLRSPFWASTELEIHADSFDALLFNPHLERYEKQGNGYVPMFEAVRDAIAEGLLEHPLHPAADTIGVFRMIDDVFAALRSAEHD